MLATAAAIASALDLFSMRLRVSSESVSMPSASIQQPDAGAAATKAGSTKLSARALPIHWIGQPDVRSVRRRTR